MPRLLDLFCGAGGAAMGYHRAGFDEIVGIDIEPQPDYPFTFICRDVFDPSHRGWHNFDLVHASPPCQAYTPMTNRNGSDAPRLIGLLRDLLRGMEISAWVIENVRGAPLEYPLELTGEMFNLPVHRPRLFELGRWFALQPAKPRRQKDAVAVYGKPDGRLLWERSDGSELRAWDSLEDGQQALEVPWITSWHGVREAIPPAYTQYIGEQYLAQNRAS